MINLQTLSEDAIVYYHSIFFFSKMFSLAKSLHLFHPGIHCQRFVNHNLYAQGIPQYRISLLGGDYSNKWELKNKEVHTA
jgi:hypothetical protein